MRPIFIALAAASILAAPAAQAKTDPAQDAAQSQSAQQNAEIPFASSGGIWDWRADGDSAVYLQDLHGQWYRAELFMPAFDLPFVQFIGIDARPIGTLDKFGAIYVDGQRYPFKSFVEVPDPTHRARG